MKKISTPEDFAKLSKERRAEIKTLPLGLVVRVCRPTPMWWITRQGFLPSSMSMEEGQEKVELTLQQKVEMAKFMVDTIKEVMIEPRVSSTPTAEEIHPNLIEDDDLTFLLRYAGGEVTTDGSDLKTFPGRTDAAPHGTGSEGVELPPVSDTGAQGRSGLAN